MVAASSIVGARALGAASTNFGRSVGRRSGCCSTGRQGLRVEKEMRMLSIASSSRRIFSLNLGSE
jgi:hypothetical protein